MNEESENRALACYELMILSAFRYALGRKSYLPHAIVPEIKKQIESGLLGQRAIGLMVKEIGEAEEANELGHDCDKKLWLDFKGWLLNISA